jgi:DNA-binding NarL/FixJ family response regulator
MSNKIKIAIADDHKIFLEAISSFLNKKENLEVVFTAVNGKELLDGLEKNKVDIVITDLDMPIMSGRQVLNIIRKKYGRLIKVIILSLHSGDLFVQKYMSAGADGYLSKTVDTDTMVEAVLTVQNDELYFSKETSKSVIQTVRNNTNVKSLIIEGESLSKREIEIAQLICRGFTCPQIGKQLNVSHKTIENHKAHIFKKFKVKSCTEMMEQAIRKGYYVINL